MAKTCSQPDVLTYLQRRKIHFFAMKKVFFYRQHEYNNIKSLKQNIKGKTLSFTYLFIASYSRRYGTVDILLHITGQGFYVLALTNL